MTYMRINNYRIRENGKKIPLFDKVNEIKHCINQILPEIENERLLAIMSHCRRYYEGKLHYGRRTNPANINRVRDLTTVERQIYDLLLRLKINPSTAYRWFLATRIPDDVKDKLAKGQISVKKAYEISANRQRVRNSNLGLLMLEEIRTTMRSL